MKKILAIVLVFTFCFALFACSAATENETTAAEETTEEAVVSTTKKTTGSSSSSGSSGGSFTNKFGTRTTVCAVSGCSNYIAKSGDSNCCTTHSNKCLECRCYIDGDAMYCMDCIMSALS